MPLINTYAIAFTTPLFMTLLSILLLGERVGVRRRTSTAIGFAAVMVMLRPGGDLFQPAGFIVLGGSILLAFNRILIRRLSITESNTTIVI